MGREEEWEELEKGDEATGDVGTGVGAAWAWAVSVCALAGSACVHGVAGVGGSGAWEGEVAGAVGERGAGGAQRGARST